MDPSSAIPKQVFSLVTIARQAIAHPDLINNILKLNKNQTALLINILQDKNNAWSNYNSKNDKKIIKIINILSGIPHHSKKIATEPASWIPDLIHAIKNSEQHLKTTHTFYDKTTNQLFHDLMGSQMKTNEDLTNQLYRDYLALDQHINIEGHVIEIKKPQEKPESWQELIPKELKEYTQNSYTLLSYIAVMLTQGIAADPVIKAMQVLVDPLFPDARFANREVYPFFTFQKTAQNEILLNVTTRGYLRVINEDGKSSSILRAYSMSQEINLSNPDALIKMQIKPEKNLRA